ncbi:RagB/SusD family nutrient uptake outer membrane protein [Algoriphagus sp. H41]|uniref:RagB/SusD family nutrient uptake outer membrane protein n=1 Tax=Algoriphagus oliviformis TaxID=2811231 RepID=A0ABS3C7L9_9BACT|nr:RagB/SusD family nutrient uptake outer membrane protein [Algoriphagus oliviformis]MBN7813124.1 RagB/SusD family nutrient uptake outer membrane protein [Algoriphagus oliviformis]
MKKHIILFFTVLSTLTLFSCGEEFLDLSDPNAVPANGFLASPADVEAAVNGIYAAIRSNNALGESSALYVDERGDDMGRNDNQSNAGEPFQFTDFSLLPSNTYLRNHWSALYVIVSRANYVINNIESVGYADESLRSNHLAQATYLRALAYYHLVRKWGAVPLVTQEIKTPDELQAVTFREAEAAVYAQIVADLEVSVGSSLPDHQPLSGKGKVSKVAAYALLGEVYLTMGSNQIEGQAPAQYFALAKQNLDAAYSRRTFGDLKEISYQSVFDVAQKSTNPELIFQIVYKQGDQNLSSAVARNNQALGETINSQRPATNSGTRVNLDLVNEYEPNDPRKTFSVKFANDSRVQEYFITKFRDRSDAAGVNGFGGNDHIMMRYADVILLLAEVNERLGNTAEAIAMLNQVRDRAGLPLYEQAMQDPSYASQYPTLKLAILHERRVELAFEQKRWYDLIRAFTVPELVEFFQSKEQSEYGIANLQNFSEKDRLYPIPFDEYKLDPERMYQNPGYN